jgi:hypothetical protein
MDWQALQGCDRLHWRQVNPDPIHKDDRKGGLTLILRNLHWSQARFAIALFFRMAPAGPEVFELDSIKMSPSKSGKISEKTLGFIREVEGLTHFVPAPKCVNGLQCISSWVDDPKLLGKYIPR